MRRLLGILAIGLMATACGLSFNPDLPQAGESDGGDGIDSGAGNGASSGDGDLSGEPQPGGSPCPDTTDQGVGGVGGGLGGDSPEDADPTIHQPCPDEEAGL